MTKEGADDSHAQLVSNGSPRLFSGTQTKEGLRNFLAGSLSGFVCKTFEYPFDTIKTLQQSQGDRFKGPLDAARKTISSHGFMSLYQGLSSPLVGAMAENAVIFAAYGKFKRMLGVEDDKWSEWWRYAMAGMGAGFFSAAILTPVELVKCNIQVQQAQDRAVVVSKPISSSAVGAAVAPPSAPGGVRYKGPIDVVVKTVRKEGLRGLYRGHTACLMRELPGNFAWFGVYESVLRAIADNLGYRSRKEIPLPLMALAGSIGGVAYWAVPFPFDTAKTLMQTEDRYRGWKAKDVLKTVFKEEGVRGLYKGLLITCIRAAPAHYLIFFSYEWADKALQLF